MRVANKSGNRYTVYPCRNKGCQNYTFHKGSLCIKCYKTERKMNGYRPSVKKSPHKIDPRKKHPCKNCGTLIRKYNGLCQKCYNKAIHIRGEIRQQEKNGRKAVYEKQQEQFRKPAKRQICPKSPLPDKNHIEIINTATNIGKCKYCGRIKDYNKLQNKDFKEKVFGGRKK